MKQAISSRARLGVILLGVAVLVAAALTATTRAASVRTSVVVTVSPHVLTVGSQGFFTIKFINAGPSTVNHVVATVRDKTGADLALPRSAFDSYPKPAGCDVLGTTTSVIRCDIGQVSPGTARRVIRFDASVVTGFTARLSATFDESKQNGLTDTVFDEDFPFAIVSQATQDSKGECTTIGQDRTLTALGASQQTSLTYHPLTLSNQFPCTPASAGVASRGDPTKPFDSISFVDFLDGAGLATVKVIFLTPPKGITKKNLALFEMANYPDLTLTANGSAVPKCVTVDGILQIPVTDPPFHSCVVGVDTFSGGGLVATLLAQGGSDPGWGGIG